MAIWAQLLILGTVVNLMFSSADAICIVLADRVATFLQSSGAASRLANRLGGGILVGLGPNLALSQR
ncbi:MAG: hypothetical protein ACWA47_04230 [Brevirhabdus sp.]